MHYWSLYTLHYFWFILVSLPLIFLKKLYFYSQLHDLLNEQIPSSDGEELADHDFDVISHTGCDYAENGKGLQLDVEKILGASTDEVNF